MKISEVQIVPIKPKDGLVAFASFVVDDALYCSSVGVSTRPQGGYRLIYPTKQIAGRLIDVFHPISAKAGSQIVTVVLSKFEEVMSYGRNRHYNPNTRTD